MEPTSNGAVKRRLRHGVDMSSRNPHTVLSLGSTTFPRKESKSLKMLWSLVFITLLNIAYWIFTLNYVSAGTQSLKTKKLEVPSSVKASVFIMNYGRPDVLKTSQLLPTLTSHDNIDEIFLLHANHETKFDYKHKKGEYLTKSDVGLELMIVLKYHVKYEISTLSKQIMRSAYPCDFIFVMFFRRTIGSS